MSRIEFIEGRRHAARIVEDAYKSPERVPGPAGLQVVLDNMRAALAGRPADFAAGVQSIIDIVKINGGVSA